MVVFIIIRELLKGVVSLMNDNLVSLLIPCYNGEEYLNTCFHSILIQTFRNLEIIFVNDGSKDGSEEIILEFKTKAIENGFKFKYIYQENKGAASAINNALKYVEGEYIMLFDVDDFLMPDSIKAKAEFLDKHKEYGMVRSNGYYVTTNNLTDDTQLFIVNNEEKQKEWIFNDLIFERTNNWPSSFMVRTKCLFEHLKAKEIYVSRYGQNLQLMLPVAYFYKSGFVDIPLTRYLIRMGSESHSSSIERNLELQNGFCNNRLEIIGMMDLPEEEKNRYQKLIKIYYIKKRIAFASEYKDKKLLKEQYILLKKEKEVTLKEMVYYVLGINPVLHIFYGCIKWVYHNCKKNR